MERFDESTAGSLLTLAIMVPLAAGAGVAWDAGGAGSSIVIMGSVAISAILATVGAVMAIERRVGYTLAAVLAFPPALLFYFPLLAIANELPAVRYVMGFGAFVLAGVFVTGSLAQSKTRAAAPRPVPQHLA
jgi:hypothetical protein